MLLAVSGGVDSSVAALLLQKAIGEKLHCVFVDNGLLRYGEFEEVKNFFENLQINFHTINAKEQFLKELDGIIDPEDKRKAIGHAFIKVFEKKSKELGDFKYLGQGTIYPDRVESAATSTQSGVIKTHHNVGGLPEFMNLDLIEPLADLYKDEVRQVGEVLGLDENWLNRHPFPGPGLAVRMLGEITEEKLQAIRECDKIVVEELKKNNLYNKVWQAFAVLLNDKTTGVMGDARTYNHAVSIRVVNSVDAMSASASELDILFLKKVANRIVNEVDGVNRVLYDLTDKPPATIEFE